MLQEALSDTLWQDWQYCISVRKSLIASDKSKLTDSGWRSKCKTSRIAVRRPIPGRCAISSTACWTNLDAYSIVAKVII
jgi:hypothetical protein